MKDAKEHLKGEDTEQIKWLSGGKSNIENVKKFITKNIKYWDNNGPVFTFAITLSDSTLIGMIEANPDYKSIEGLKDGDVNISYGIYPDYRGKGYAIEAISLFLGFLKAKGGTQAVMRVNPENKSSLRIPEKLGFEKINTITTKDKEIMDVFIKNLN